MQKEYVLKSWQIIHGNCLVKFADIDDSSIDLCIADLPYGSTAQEWDELIPIDPMWDQLKRIVKKNGAILLFAQGLYMAQLMLSQKKAYRFTYIWKKNRVSNPHLSKIMPMRNHEEIAVFCFGKLPYFPQKSEGHKPTSSAIKKANSTKVYRQSKETTSIGGNTTRLPKTVLEFDCVDNNSFDRLHSNQKPLSLIRHLIRQHSNEGEIVLDYCSGSGSTGAAAILENRRFIGIESDDYSVQNSRNYLNKLTQEDYKLSFVDVSDKPLFSGVN